MKFNETDVKYRQLNDFIGGELRRQKVRQSTVATWLGIPQSSVARRLSGEIEWSAREVISLFELLGVKEWK